MSAGVDHTFQTFSTGAFTVACMVIFVFVVVAIFLVLSSYKFLFDDVKLLRVSQMETMVKRQRRGIFAPMGKKGA
jgi:hypothetical protein